MAKVRVRPNFLEAIAMAGTRCVQPLSRVRRPARRMIPDWDRAKGGSGLGLAICEGIIKAHGGLIYAQHSELGGLTVVIELPLNK